MSQNDIHSQSLEKLIHSDPQLNEYFQISVSSREDYTRLAIMLMREGLFSCREKEKNRKNGGDHKKNDKKKSIEERKMEEKMKIKNEGYVNDSGKKGSTKKIGQGQQGELQKIPYGENTRGRNNDIKGQQGEMRLGLFEEIGQTQMRSPMSPPNIPRPVSMKGKLNKNEVTAKVTQIVPTSLEKHVIYGKPKIKMISSNGCILHEEDKQVVGNVEQMVKTEKDIGHGLSREGKDMKESKKKQPVSANNVEHPSIRTIHEKMDESHYLQPKILSPPPFQKKHSKTNGNVGKSPGSVKSPTGSQQFIQGQGQVQGQGQGQSQGQGQAYQQSSQGTTQLRMHSPGPRLSSPTTAPVNMLKPNYEKVQSKIKPWVDELKMRRVQELKEEEDKNKPMMEQNDMKQKRYEQDEGYDKGPYSVHQIIQKQQQVQSQQQSQQSQAQYNHRKTGILYSSEESEPEESEEESEVLPQKPPTQHGAYKYHQPPQYQSSQQQYSSQQGQYQQQHQAPQYQQQPPPPQYQPPPAPAQQPQQPQQSQYRFPQPQGKQPSTKHPPLRQLSPELSNDSDEAIIDRIDDIKSKLGLSSELKGSKHHNPNNQYEQNSSNAKEESSNEECEEEDEEEEDEEEEEEEEEEVEEDNRDRVTTMGVGSVKRRIKDGLESEVVVDMCGRRCARLSEGVSSCSGCSECEEKSEISGGQEERREVGRGEMDRQYERINRGSGYQRRPIKQGSDFEEDDGRY